MKLEKRVNKYLDFKEIDIVLPGVKKEEYYLQCK